MQKPPLSSRAMPLRASNLNPLSSSGTLGALEFIATMLVLSTVLGLFSWYMHGRIMNARQVFEVKGLLRVYGFWALGSSLGFFMVTNAFIKRWATILELEIIPGLLRTMIRVALLSPLLSIWATILTLLFGRHGLVLEGGPRVRVFVMALASLALFHAGYIGLHARKGQVSGERLYVHLYPYLDPGGKYALSLVKDFSRAEALEEKIKRPDAPICQQKSQVLGVDLPDCFLLNYKRLAEERPFASPIIGFMFETKYRQASTERIQAQIKQPNASPFTGFASALLALRNIVWMIEPNETVLSRASYFWPKGLLPYYGSPEIPLMEFGQDVQSYLLATKLLPAIKPQVHEMEKALEAGLVSLEPKLAQEASQELERLKKRIARLENDPLRITWLTAGSTHSVQSADVVRAQ